MLDHSTCRPAIDLEVFPDTPSRFRSPFWSSTSHFQGAEGLVQYAVGLNLGSNTYNGDVTRPTEGWLRLFSVSLRAGSIRSIRVR